MLVSILTVEEDEKEELAVAWATVREKQQEVPPRSVTVGGHEELRMAELHQKGSV